MSSAQTLADQFLEDFGFTRPRTEDIGPVTVGSRQYTFTVCNVAGHPEQVWISTHSEVYLPDSPRGLYSAQVASQLELSLATVALSVRAINDVPLWKFVEQVKLVTFTDAEKADINDPLWPPVTLHRKAAEAFAVLLGREGTAFDRNLVSYLAEQVAERFAPKFVLPDDPQEARFAFKCEEEACHYVFVTETPEDFRESLVENNQIHCPKCGGAARPPKGEEVDNPDSPLSRRLTRGVR